MANITEQIATVEARIAEMDTLIACESGSIRTHAIECRYHLSEKLAELRDALPLSRLMRATVMSAGEAAEMHDAGEAHQRRTAIEWAIEARDLPALTAIVAANNAERGEVAA